MVITIAVCAILAVFIAGGIGMSWGYEMGFNDGERGILLGPGPNAKAVNPKESD